MDTSVFLAKIIGLFGALSTLLIMVRYKRHVEMEHQAASSGSMIYLSGYFFLLAGIYITVTHPVWSMDWRVIITFIGWIVLAKGLLRILWPEKVRYILEKKKSDKRFFLGEIGVFIISAYLVYRGFKG